MRNEHTTRWLRAVTIATAVAAGLGYAEVPIRAIDTGCGMDMRVLVISADGAEADLPAITTTLDYIGTPYTVYVAKGTPGGLTPDRLNNGCHANYQAVIITTGAVDNQFSGVLTMNELQALHTFESQFRVREIVWYTFPNDFGLTFTGNTANTILPAAPLPVTLTTAGRTIFPYINVSSGARPLLVEQATVYLAQPEAGASTTPIVKDAGGNTLVAVTTTSDGRDILAQTFDSNAYSLQTLLFGYGLVNWVTRGMFVGDRRIYLSAQVDDVLIDDDRWTAGTSCALVGHDLNANGTGPTVRMTGTDLAAVALWQLNRNANSQAGNLRLTLAINGWGTTKDFLAENRIKSDTLTKSAKTLAANFHWVSHTYDHPVLDGLGYAAVMAELTMNNAVAAGLGLANYSTTSLVTPNVSGLNDAQAMQAIADAGVKYIVTDTSQPGQDNPYPNVGMYNLLQPKVFMIPRRPVNLFYNVATPADWVAEYNCLYRSFFGRDLTYQQILDFVSSQLLPYLLRGEADPWMFHQPNLVAYDGRHTLLTDLLDLTLAKYNGYFALPILSPTMDALGAIVEKKTQFHASNVIATLQPGVSLTIYSSADATVPITGLAGAGAESYGGQSTLRIAVKAGQAVSINVANGTTTTLRPPPAPTLIAPATGATGIAATATLSWSGSNTNSYDVRFGTTNPPPTVTSTTATSYTPALTTGTTYYWQIVANNAAGSTAGPVWSFTTLVPVVPRPEIVVYASDIPASALHGTWTLASDATSPNGITLATPDNGWSTTDVPLASPADYVDVTFTADANAPYTVWFRLKALNNNKFNDAVWVQFADALAGGAPIYPINSTSALLVNLATDALATSLNNWGWAHGAYWLTQTTTVSFATTGPHTMRIQVREDGVRLDQIVLSSGRYASAAPGGPTGDATIVAKP